MLAMHMANELLTRPVAGAFFAISAGVLAVAARRAQATFDPMRVPLMGVLGAFVFAAEMINFPILPGTSGHLSGAVLLAILLGPHAGVIVMASILIVQCLIFQDGGLLALGTNILNMGIIPCYLGYAVFCLVLGRAASRARRAAAVFAATFAGMLTGAAMVPVETALAGVLAVPFGYFLTIMVALHALIAGVEALITVGLLAYVERVRPELLPGRAGAAGRVSSGLLAGSILLAALALAGVGSLLASDYPDALEFLSASPGHAMVRSNSNPAIEQVSDWQQRTAPLAEYHVPGLGARLGTSVSGLIGTVVTLLAVWVASRWLRRKQRRDKPGGSPSRATAVSAVHAPHNTIRVEHCSESSGTR